MEFLGLMMQIIGYGGDFMVLLERLDFFRYWLPFILIFAVIFAILSKVPTFKDNKGAMLLISAAIGLLSLQFGVVPRFFQEIFPNLGIGLSVLIAALILMGAFLPGGENDKYQKLFLGIGIVIFILVVASSFSGFHFYGMGGWWYQWGDIIVTLAIIGGAIAVIVKWNESQGSGAT